MSNDILKVPISGAEHLKNLWRDSAGLAPVFVASNYPRPDEVLAKQWCPEWETGLKRRMLMGAFRYGYFDDKTYAQSDLVKEVHRRADLYSATGNLEHLLDAGNYVMMAFKNGLKLKQSVESIDDGVHFFNTVEKL